MDLLRVLAIMMAFLSPLAAAPRRGQAPPQVDPEKMDEVMRETQLQQLEELKSSNPEAYEKQKEVMERSEKIARILADARDKRLSEAEAERKLLPIMKKVMEPELDGLDERIAQLERELASLKKAKKDPDSLVRQRVEEMLGKRPPESDDSK